LRKDGQTPYASHPFRVCLIVRHVFGVDDPHVLTAAVLHDTIEDTTTDFDDLHARFGQEVAGWVATLSKDKRRIDAYREREYIDALARSGWQVQVCKLGDIYDNLSDTNHLPAEKRARTVARSRAYLDALAVSLKPEARRAYEVVRQLFQDVQSRM
jgi:guanosine-3',5'-bis(diphosphate) 3'-pyrophosphohydrolase